MGRLVDAALLALAFPTDGTSLGLLAFASVLVAGLLVVLVASRAHGVAIALYSSPTGGRASALRDQTQRAAYLRVRDPGAPGRRRPRAPGLRSPAA